MPHRSWIRGAFLLLLAAGAAGAAQEKLPQNDAPLNAEQIRALVSRAIAGQHGVEQALDQYDRTERVVSRDSDQKDGAATDTTFRVVPTGSGLLRVVLARDGKPAAPAEINQGWRDVAKALAVKSNPNDPLVKLDYEKTAKRNTDRAQLVDDIEGAFRFRWVGRTTRDGRAVIELAFEPQMGYRPSTRYGIVYKHLWGTLWLEASSGHVVGLEAQLGDDIYFGAGIIAKIYRGGRLELEQTEVEPGVWLPTHYSIDVEGRKFLFEAASYHQKVDASGYRRVGPPLQALALIRREHADAIDDP